MNRRRRSNPFWRGLRILIWILVIIALGPSLINLPRAWIACRVWEKPQGTETTTDNAAIREAVQKIPDYYRPESKTYLSLPEWYTVYSADEYATFLQDHRSGEFPYFQAVGQFWQSYLDACIVISGRYP